MRIKRETDPPKRMGSSPRPSGPPVGLGRKPVSAAPSKPAPKPAPKNEPVRSKNTTTVLRNAIPLPMPVSQMVASTIASDNRLGWDNLHSSEQYELARSVINARQRTGQDRGGTEYVDYSPQVERDINSLGGKLADVAIGSVFSPEFRTATTMGRVSYRYNPETDVYSVYDSYDFSPTSSKKTTYAAVRSAAGEYGVTSGEPNLVATFKGSDYAGPRPEGGATYKQVTDFTDQVSQQITNRLEAIGDMGTELYNKLYGYISEW